MTQSTELDLGLDMSQSPPNVHNPVGQDRQGPLELKPEPDLGVDVSRLN